MATAKNKIDRDCHEHRKICNLFCTFPKCVDRKILCEKCVPDHLQDHPKQFIYNVENLTEIHSLNKVDKMREILVMNKMFNEATINDMYKPFPMLLEGLARRLQRFEKESS